MHERCLRVIYKVKTSSFKEPLERDRSVPVHNRNLHIFAAEMFKVYNNIIALIFTEICNKRNLKYELRHPSHFSVPHEISLYNEMESP